MNGVYRQLYETQFRTVIEQESQEEGQTFDIGMLSSDMTVKRITDTEIPDILDLFRNNRRYYRSMNLQPSMRGLTDIMRAIGWFIVKAELQRKGIGSQIFADVRAALESMDIRSVRFNIAKHNEDAVPFWEKQGFRFTGEESVNERGFTTAIMEREV